jgi:DMSO/TMAO reductase YedYZ molybdopterin-dependent catalytic subunit
VISRATDLARRFSGWAAQPVPAPPAALRRGPFGRLPPDGGAHGPRSAALLGRAAGTAILVCLVTGYISHLHQHPLAWLDMPSRPVQAYRFTQGLHVVAGIAAVPLVLAKLWVVYLRLFTWPPARDTGHALERILLVPLVAGTLFQLVTGLQNIVQWYPWGFFFPSVHWALAWVTAGAVLVHVATKAPIARAHAGRRRQPEPPSPERRALLVATGAAVGAVTLATAGQTVGPLRAVSLLAPRDPAVGPQGLPVNRTARSARVIEAATDPGWRLTVEGPRPVRLSLAELGAMPQHDARLPIACVEGWSAEARWSGVRLRDLLDLAGLPPDARVRVVSLERGRYQSSPVGPRAAADPLTLLALRLNGETLALDHGFPVRLIGPNRPGVLQTKWLRRIEPF